MISHGCNFWTWYKLQPYKNHNVWLKIWKCYEVFEVDIYNYYYIKSYEKKNISLNFIALQLHYNAMK